MRLHEILREKGCTVFTIESIATMARAAEELVNHRCGALVVCDGPQIKGVLSERDVLRAVVSGEGPLKKLPVSRCMTHDVVTGKSTDLIVTAMAVMTEKRIRHLPIVEEGILSGMVSIGDLVKAVHDQMVIENRFLQDYIQS